jgi:hypothetical protein
MRLRPVDWSKLLEDEDARLPLEPIAALFEAQKTNPVPVSGADKQIQFFVKSANLIPSSVIEIDSFWKARRRSALDKA